MAGIFGPRPRPLAFLLPTCLQLEGQAFPVWTVAWSGGPGVRAPALHAGRFPKGVLSTLLDGRSIAEIAASLRWVGALVA